MTHGMEFASLMTSLRAPRVAIAIPDTDWSYFARRGLEFFSRTWGGAGGVLIPVADGQVAPAVGRLLRRYDPDYLTTLQFSVGDKEALQPGWPIEVDGRTLKGKERSDFLARVEERGPQIMGTVIGREALTSLANDLTTFGDDDGDQKIYAVHPEGSHPNELSAADPDEAQQVLLESGDDLVDLALAIRNGCPATPSEVRRVSDDSLTYREAADLLTRNEGFQVGSPFEATRRGLSWINYGLVRNQVPVCVFGRTGNDMALAMLWDRLVGTGVWLPFTGSHTRWHPFLGSAIDWSRLRAGRKFVITSHSWSEDRCNEFMRRLWAARMVWDPSDAEEPWRYEPPGELDPRGRVDLRMNDRWDERSAVPVTSSTDGSAEMATTFPLLAPENLDKSPRGWIVETEWFGHPVHSHYAIRGSDLMAAAQDKNETFVRASGRSISFESGRFDFVAAGASKYGQLAQPRLRWPGLLNTLRLAAASDGYRVQSSHAGRTGRLTSELWRGRERLAEDLTGSQRVLLDAFVTTRTKNGPIDRGDGVTNENTRLMVSGTCVVPLGALERISGASIAISDIRSWLDELIEAGAVRLGLVLECLVCPWADFYRIDEVGTHFACKRCGSANALAQGRWRDPVDEPRWYYSLHPTIVEFLRNNGDVPILAVRQFGAERRAFDIEFELEILAEGEARPKVEIDFAFMSRDGLVIGEAKSVGKLDGQNEKERVRDVTKLLDAAQILGASEVCFATGKTWGSDSIDAIATATGHARRTVTVSVLERLGTSSPGSRRILHNPAGP